MCFKPNISLTNNTLKEQSSVKFITDLFFGKVNPLLTINDRTPNIDGYIELLDESQRTCGKIAVQVKTVNVRDEGKKSFPCPTSLFGYAYRTTDIVFLFAVDHSNKWVLCKYISSGLISQNNSKATQDTITLHFSDDEVISTSNIEKFIAYLKRLCTQKSQLFFNGDNILEENKLLKAKIMELNPNPTNLSNSDIKEIQTFFECYNSLLDNDFSVIKESLFHDVWKRGVAISEYTDTSLGYSLFNVKNGEMLNPIIQIPQTNFFELVDGFKYDFAQHSGTSNPIKENPHKLALSLIKCHVERFLKYRRVIPSNVTFLKEYAFDYLNEHRSRLRNKKIASLNIETLIEYLDNKYPNIIERNITLIVNGRRHIYVSTIYNALVFLRDNGETNLDSPYPTHRSFAHTNNPADVCSTNAFSKCKIVLESVIKEYQNFIYNRFPKLASALDLYQDNNLIIVLFDYSQDPFCALVQLNFFRAENLSASKVLLIEDLNNKSPFLESLDLPSTWMPFWYKREIEFEDQKYIWTSAQNLNSHDVVFGKYNAITLFYKFLEAKFREYFKMNGIK